MVWAAVGVSVASSLLSSSQKDDSWKASAMKNGRARAQVVMSKARAQALLPAKAREVSEAATAAQVNSQVQEASAVAEATVAAAASGSTGANVEQTKQSLEGNAARVQQSIRKQRTSNLLQINQEFEDITWNALNQQSTTVVSGGTSTGTKLATAALAGFGAYAGRKSTN